MRGTRLFTGLLAVVLLAGCASSGQKDMPKIDKRLAAQANTQLGIEYLRSGNYEMSMNKLSKALELDPEYIGAHEAIAVLYEKVEEDELAEKHYRKALKLEPNNARGHNNYGQFLCLRGRYDDAQEQFRMAAENPYYATPSLPLTNAGLCALRIPDDIQAEEFFRKALELSPDYSPALLQMGNISYGRGNYLSARGYLQRYHQVSRHTPESLWLAVRTEYSLNNHEAWGNYALMLRNNFPNSDQAKRLQEWERERRAGQ